jgi:hypothetical protein
MSGTISLLPTYQHGVDRDKSSSSSSNSSCVYCCSHSIVAYREDITEQPQYVVPITDRSHFTQFLLHCSASTQKFAQLSNLHVNYLFNTV